MNLFLPFLAVFGALSPLLTLAWLWQLKEWRWDRLREHLQREGWVGQLWGKIRPSLVAIYFFTRMVEWLNGVRLPDGQGWADGRMVNGGILLILAGLTGAQIVLRKQRRPVFTQKAVTVTGTAFILTVLLTIFLWTHHPAWLPVIVLLQPLTITLSWFLWYPVDTFLKHRIIAQARALREQHPQLTVIGVTGSVGKTTTKELLACVLKDLNPSVTPAYVNAEIGVARWLNSQFSILNSQLMIVEMGAYRKGEIATLCAFAQPTIGVVTHVGTQHIALFGSQEQLFQAKSELIRSLPADGRAFLNGDNALARQMKAVSPCPTVIVGTGGPCDLEAFDIEETATGIRFTVRDIIIHVPLHGTHNVCNILLAIAAGEHLGVKLERMCDLLRTFTPLSGTFSIRTEAGVRILDDTHNSSTASMKAAIAWARTQPERQKILLTAGLIEMGDLQSPAEQELGALAGKVFERVIVTDDQSAKNFAAGGGRVETLSSRSEKIPAGSLLVCTGRMAGPTIKSILP